MGVREDAIVQKYAHSFVDRIADREDVWHIYDEVHRFLDITKETELNHVLLSSTVSVQDKENFIRTMRQSEYRIINDMIENMIEDGHSALLTDVFEEILSGISKQKNEFDAVITSVYPLSDEQKERLCALVEGRFALKVRNVIEEIDKELLGGFVITVNHRVIDASVRTQLKDIRKRL